MKKKNAFTARVSKNMEKAIRRYHEYFIHESFENRLQPRSVFLGSQTQIYEELVERIINI